MPGPPVFAAIRPTSWDAARDLARRLPRSAFRGQPDASQVPSTSIERAAARLHYDRHDLHTLEERMLRDFSQSFYVAVWFAIESADGDAAVWAVDLGRLREAAGKKLAAVDPDLAE